MKPTLHTENPPSRARWAPCHRACYQTLRWPLSEPAAARSELPVWLRAPAGPAVRLLQVPQPAHRLLALCDEEGLRHLVQCHMRRLRHTPLFARAGRCFECVAQRVADFVVEACGGPLYYSERHTRLMAGAGLPLLLDAEGREVWLVQLWHAFDDAAFPQALRADYWRWAEPLSVHLLAPQARQQAVTRYPFDTVQSWFPAPARRGLPVEAVGSARA